MTDTTTDDAKVVTDERAAMLAQHAIFVQGGFSTPEIERARAEADLAAGGTIDWDTMQAEVNAALLAMAMGIVSRDRPAAPTPTPHRGGRGRPHPSADCAARGRHRRDRQHRPGRGAACPHQGHDR